MPNLNYPRNHLTFGLSRFSLFEYLWALVAKPEKEEFEYRIIAVNKAGECLPNNVVEEVL